MPKLPEGMRKRPNGYIEYRFRIGNERKSVSGKTIEEVRARAEKLIQNAHLNPGAESVTFNEYCEEWLAGKRSQVKESTIYSYQKKIKMVAPLIGSKKLQKLDRRDLQKAQADLYGHYSSATTNYVMALVKTILDDAVVDNIIPRNPHLRIKGVKKKDTESIFNK